MIKDQKTKEIDDIINSNEFWKQDRNNEFINNFIIMMRYRLQSYIGMMCNKYIGLLSEDEVLSESDLAMMMVAKSIKYVNIMKGGILTITKSKINFVIIDYIRKNHVSKNNYKKINKYNIDDADCVDSREKNLVINNEDIANIIKDDLRQDLFYKVNNILKNINTPAKSIGVFNDYFYHQKSIDELMQKFSLSRNGIW